VPPNATEKLKRCLVTALLVFVPSLPANSHAQRPTSAMVVSRLHEIGCALPEGSGSSRIPGLLQGKFRQSSKTDWAFLCDRGQEITLAVISSEPELRVTEIRKSFAGDGAHLRPREISTASKKFIVEHCDSSRDRIPPIEHDGILDMVGIPVVHYYFQGKWLDLAVVG
jgi:hypothetical protein